MKKNYLLLKEIDLPNLGKIYPPITEDVLGLSDGEFNRLLSPFFITLKDLELNQEVLKSVEEQTGREFTIFDYLVSNTDTIDSIIYSLKYFYKIEGIYFNQDKFKGYFLINFIVSGNSYLPNKGAIILTYKNWDELCNLIKDLMCISDNKKEERKITIDHEENRAVLEEYLRLQKQKEEEDRKLAEKNALSLHDLITIVASDCAWDYDRVLNMTYYRLVNAYRSIMSEDNYKTSLMYHMSEKWDTSNMKIKYWIDDMKKND